MKITKGMDMAMIMKIIKSIIKRRFGFAIPELLAVVAIMSIIATISVPTVFRYVEIGRQVNRMSIARSLYLAAQNQMTELRITRNLDEAVKRAGIDTDNQAAMLKTNVFEALGYAYGDTENWADAGNEKHVHFVSKPAGYVQGSGDPGADFVLELLKPVVTYNEALEHAILIEFNVITGIVLTVIYTDVLPADPSLPVVDRRFHYGGEDSDTRNVLGPRVMGDREYGRNMAHSRKQGYYGVENTGVLPLVIEPMEVMIFDSYDDRREAEALGFYMGNPNTLYAMILITPESYEDNHELRVTLSSGDREVYSGTFKPQDVQRRYDFENSASPESFNDDLFKVDIENNIQELIGYGIIWVLDYVEGDTSKLLRGIERFREHDPAELGLEPMELITVTVRDMEIGSVKQSFAKYPYTGAGTSGNNFVINTARHLNNIRHINDMTRTQREPEEPAFEEYKFMQRQSINLATISHFEPIPVLLGSYSGNYNTIENLRVNKNSGNAGLFADVNDDALVERLTMVNPNVETGAGYAGAVAGMNASAVNGIRNVSIINPSISANNRAGGVVGLNSGLVENAFVKYGDDNGGDFASANSELLISSSGGSSGGVAGTNEGAIRNTTFISPYASVHISGEFAGGIVGGYNAGIIENALFLAIAPKAGDEIVPITRFHADYENAVVRNVYYLSGRDSIRPSVQSIHNAVEAGTMEERNGYNMEPPHHNYGAPLATWDLYDTLNKAEGVSLPDWIRWTQPSVLSELDVLDLDNEDYYPYPYIPRWNNEEPRLRTVPANSNWPIVEEGTDEVILPEALITYYEIYSNGTWGYDHLELEQPLINGNAVVAHDGYAVRMAFVPGEHELHIGFDTPISFTLSEFGGIAMVEFENRNWPTRIEYTHDENGNDVTLVWLFIPNHELEASALLRSDHLITVYLNEEEVADAFNPFFAPDFGIRSPRHLDNIDIDIRQIIIEIETEVENEEGQIEIVIDEVAIVVGTYLSKSFTQQLDLDFGLYRKVLGWQGGSLAPSGYPLVFTQSVVRGGFSGTYIGNERKIQNMEINATDPNTLGVGLFELISEGGVVRDLHLIDCSATSSSKGGAGVGILAGINIGIIDDIIVEDSYVAINGPDTSMLAGGIAGINNEILVNVSVINSIIEAESGIGVGGIAGVNNKMINNASIEDSRIAVNGTNSMSAGGVTAINTDLIYDVSVINNEITISNGTAGGVSGLNNSGRSISAQYRENNIIYDSGIIKVVVRGNEISATEYGTVGGVAGIQNSVETVWIWDPELEELVEDTDVEIIESIIKDAFLDGNLIFTEAGSAAGVVAVNSGSISNVVFLSVNEDTPVVGLRASGVVMTNFGSIIDVIYIAAVPEQTPIAMTTEDDSVIENAYYLSSYPSVSTNTPYPGAQEYNHFLDSAEYGQPRTTIEINGMAPWDGWTIDQVSSEASLLAVDARFPYPIPIGLEPPEKWPLAFTVAAVGAAVNEAAFSMQTLEENGQAANYDNSVLIVNETVVIAPEETQTQEAGESGVEVSAQETQANEEADGDSIENEEDSILEETEED